VHAIDSLQNGANEKRMTIGTEQRLFVYLTLLLLDCLIATQNIFIIKALIRVSFS